MKKILSWKRNSITGNVLEGELDKFIIKEQEDKLESTSGELYHKINFMNFLKDQKFIKKKDEYQNGFIFKKKGEF